MRTQHRGRSGINHEQFMAAVRAGQAQALIQAMARSYGLAVDASLGGTIKGMLTRSVIDKMNDEGKVIGKAFGDLVGDPTHLSVAMDAQPELITTPNTGIPSYLSNVWDPALIEILVSPMKAAQIAGEAKKGDWTSTQATFHTVESDGEVVAYGDYNEGGNADFNTNFPTRQPFHYQVFTRWGEKELAWLGLAGVDAASRKNIASALVLNKFQNKSYFLGIAGLQNYGLLNDPSLLPAITPSTAYLAATADQEYQNMLDLFQQLVRQSMGLVDAETPMTLAMSTDNATNLQKTNQYGLNVKALLRENFPNLTIKTAPEYSTATGELVQLMVDEWEGQETMTAAFTEKLRAHAVIQDSSSWKQKKSQGTWGTIIYRPVLVAQQLG